MTPAWSQAHTAPRLHIPKIRKPPRHRGCWCKGPRHVARTGKKEPFHVRIAAWGQGMVSFNWDERSQSQTPLLDTGCLQGINLTVEGKKAQPHIYYLKYMQGTIWQVFLLLFKTTGDWNFNQISKLFLPSLLNTLSSWYFPNFEITWVSAGKKAKTCVLLDLIMKGRTEWIWKN